MFFLDSINFFGGVSSAIQAALLLIVGLVAAAIARFVIKKIVLRVIDSRAKKAGGNAPAESDSDTKKNINDGLAQNRTQIASIIGNLVFAIVFLLFLPGALDKLGVDSVASPISGMARKFVEFIPRIVAAIIIVVFGYFLSKLVRDILKMVLQKTKLDNLHGKLGIKPTKGYTFSGIISNIVFALMMIVFVIAALQALQLHSISDPASEMLGKVFTYLPLILAAAIVIIIGIFIANLVSGLLENVLAGTGIDEKTKGMFPKSKTNGEPVIVVSKLCGIIVKVVINIFFVVAGLRILNIEVLSNIGTTIIAYLPNILAAAIVAIIAWIVADKIYKAILKTNPKGEGLAKGIKYLIYIIAAFMIVSQLHIATNIVHILFFALVIGAAAAFAIAFGVGGRGWAAKKLEEFDSAVKEQRERRAERKASTASSSSETSSETAQGSAYSEAADEAEAYAGKNTESAAKAAADDLAGRTQEAAAKAQDAVKETADAGADDAEARKSRIRFRKNK